jgi:hypothetical protein
MKKNIMMFALFAVCLAPHSRLSAASAKQTKLSPKLLDGTIPFPPVCPTGPCTPTLERK